MEDGWLISSFDMCGDMYIRPVSTSVLTIVFTHHNMGASHENFAVEDDDTPVSG